MTTAQLTATQAHRSTTATVTASLHVPAWLIAALLLVMALMFSMPSFAAEPASTESTSYTDNEITGQEDAIGNLLKKIEDTQNSQIATPAESTKSQSMIDKMADKVAEVAAHAVSLIGVRYKYGGNTPETGFDCSGYVRHVFSQAVNVVLPRRSEEISRKGQEVLRTDVQPGDLVFFNTRRKANSHVGIYLGDNQFIHAPSSGGEVRIENMAEPYWTKRWNGARRITL